MAQTVVMPQAGNTVESCILVSWNVAVGDSVEASTVLCEAETDKSTIDVESGVSGTVLALLAEEGDEVPVKDPIILIGNADENAEAALKELGIEPQTTGEAGEVDESSEDPLTPEADETATTSEPAAPEAAERPAPVAGAPASPRARGRASHEGIDLDSVSGTGPHGRIIEQDVVAAAASGRGASAAVKASGEYRPGEVQGTGLGGRVRRSDLEGAAEPAAAFPAATGRDYPGATTQTPLKGVRKLIADRMRNALETSAQLSYTTSANAAALLALRARFKNSDPALGYSAITIGDLVCFATVKTLASHSVLNAHLEGGTLTEFAAVHLGLAVDTPRGLLVPTIRNASAMGIRELSATTKDLASQAIGGKIDPELLSGATFTVSNLGAFGIESFTPIINVPQTGILGVNTISPRATTDADGNVVVEQRIGFSLTADHQVVDGADAARFLRDLVAAIENIDLTVIG